MQAVRKGLRGVRAGWGATRSAALLGWYKSLYGGLKVGRRVRLGRGVHISVVRGATLTIDDDVEIERDCQLISEGELSVGSGSFIGTGTIIVAAAKVTVGRNALIAAQVTIRDQDHRLDDAQLPYNRQGLATAPVLIGDNVWIGTKATILRGVKVGNGAVIGAHALVIETVEPRTIVGGVPAKTLKRLDDTGS